MTHITESRMSARKNVKGVRESIARRLRKKLKSRHALMEKLEQRQMLTVASDPIEPLATSDQPIDVQLGIVDANTSLDLIAVGADGQTTVAFNGDDGSWINRRQDDLAVGPVLGFETAFLNQDVTSDLVVQSPDAIHVFSGSTDGAFTLTQSLVADNLGDFGHASGRVDLGLANINSDFVIDLATVVPQTDQVKIFPGNIDGSFQTPITLSSGASQPIAVASGNLIGNPLVDIVVGHVDGTVTFLEGQSDGQFALRNDLSISGLGVISDLVVDDLDGDGDFDVVVAGGNQANLLLNDNDVLTTNPIVNGDFSASLFGWNAEVIGHQDGDRPGTVNANGGELQLTENESFLVSANQSFTVPPDPADALPRHSFIGVG